MKKRLISLLLILLIVVVPLMTACGATPSGNGTNTDTPSSNAPSGTDPAPADEKVVLTMGSWRTDDKAQMDALLALYTAEVAPNVEIVFQPVNPPDYNATLRLQLENGTGPDLMYARSYATGVELFESGYFADCTNIAGLQDNFSDSNLAPWRTADGKMFAVPFAAVSHAVYYNKAIFNEAGVSVPNTWEEFMTVCETLKSKGYTPFANGLGEEWDILECFFLGMLPNYIGGADQRVLYENKEKPLNDKNFVEAYEDIAGVAPYLPSGFEAVTYNDSQALFSSEGAAMFVDGSWTISVYDDVGFDWGVFAIPAPAGKETAVTFHPDMAITMNAASEHKKEAEDFLAWLCTEEGVKKASASLPTGFFPMIEFPITLEDAHANEFLALNSGKQTDARFVWPKLMDLYSPMNQAVISVIKSDITPQEAADSVNAILQ